MALMQCPECEKSVSDKAPACIHCGAPLRPAGNAATSVVTTQQTAKKYKGAQLVGLLLICGGVVSCVGKEPLTSTGLWTVGVIVWLGARAAAWWRHA